MPISPYPSQSTDISDNSSSIKVSLIIGCIYPDLGRCKYLLTNLGSNLNHIDEIICVISGLDDDSPKLFAQDLEALSSVQLTVKNFSKTLFPGAARNHGITYSNGKYLAFLDVSTIPPDNWLFESLVLIKKYQTDAIFGRTIYSGKTVFERSFIASTYGFNPLYTLPGSIVTSSFLAKTGFFIPSVRAGEDAEWMDRSLHFNKKIKVPDVPPLIYINLRDKNLIQLLKKWYRNYRASSLDILLYEHQRYLYIGFVALVVFGIAFFWNWQVAGWNQDTYLYIPHATKIALSSIISMYIIFRNIVLPIRKGLRLNREHPLTLLYVLLISFLIDLIKFSAYINSTVRRIIR